MPNKMSGYIQSVVVQGPVYVGGGVAGYNSDSNYVVMALDTSTSEWVELPPYEACGFAMAVVSNQLMLVGGNEHGDRSKVVGVWRPDCKEWTHPYPDMVLARVWCSALGYKDWLVVVGGEGDDGADMSSVEVMNVHTKQWTDGLFTPITWSYMRAAVVGDMCYFMGGYVSGVYTNTVYVVSLPLLILSQFRSNSGETDSEIWKEMPEFHLTRSTPLNISGSLCAVGGRDGDDRAVSGIHLYRPDTGEWVKAMDLPTPRFGCTCTSITKEILLVAGGNEGGHRLKRVDVAKIVQ